MDYEIVTLEKKLVVGLKARTNNHAPDMGAVIGGMWNQFYQGGVYERIPDKADGKAIGLYTEYAGGADDDYTAMVCCAVERQPEADSYASCRIPAGSYAKFVIVCDMDTAVAEVAKAWGIIWSMDLDRTFICDFEEYQSSDPDHQEIHIYIGLKSHGTPRG